MMSHVLTILALLAVVASVGSYLLYRRARREERKQQENQQYHCYGCGFTYQPLQEYVFYQGNTRTWARLCATCAKHRHAVPARASVQSRS